MDLNHDVNPREMLASEDDMEINSDKVNEWPNFNYELEDDDGTSDGVTNCNFDNYDCHQDNASWECLHEETTNVAEGMMRILIIEHLYHSQ